MKAPVRVVWAALADAGTVTETYPPVRVGPTGPDWPAAGSVRHGNLRIGPLGIDAIVESLEARPRTRLHLRVVAGGLVVDQLWHLAAVAGGTRVVHEVRIASRTGVRRLVIRPGEKSVQDRVERHLAALKGRAEEMAATMQATPTPLESDLGR